MIGEIIAIGDELTTGRIPNTTSTFVARQLFAAGHEIYAMHTIGDTPDLIGEALKRAIKRVDFVIVTGGLGATTDDLTNEAVSRALDRPATVNTEILEKIRSQLEDTNGLPSALEKLAWLPEGAEVFNASERMAGYMLIHDATPVFFLPGVPEQARTLLTDHVLPRISAWKNNTKNHVRLRVYRTVGLPEFEINHLLSRLERRQSINIGYYPVGSEVHVSLTVSGDDNQHSDRLFHEADCCIREALGLHIYGTDHQSLAQVTGDLLLERDLQFSVAESCTGGLIGSHITQVPGSSGWFTGGVIAYSNHLKKTLLNVDHEQLDKHGAVSDQVARAMASGIARRTGTQLALSVTGIAGPGGGSAEKPVGTVYIGFFFNNTTTATLHQFSGNRLHIQQWTAQTALDTVRRALLK